MTTYSHAIYIDESGNGSPTADIHRYWVSAALAVAFDKTAILDEGVRRILRQHFRSFVIELKGVSMPRYLTTASSVMAVAGDLGKLLDEADARTWAVGSSFGARPPRGLRVLRPRVKDVVRQLLLERLNSSILSGNESAGRYVVIWDISYQQELHDFSASIANFRNGYNSTARCDRLAPAVLGGLSHDWSGLQCADVVAHCALHYLGCLSSLKGAKSEKAEAFRVHFLPRLLRHDTNGCQSWKVWQ